MERSRTQILGENLKRIRTEKNISRKELAENLGVGVDSVGLYENGKTLPPLDKIFELADYLQVSVASLTGENHFADNYADLEGKISDIEKTIEKQIFEYRFKRAQKMAIRYLDSLANRDLKPDENGRIVIDVPARVEFNSGVLVYKADDKGNIGNSIIFKNVEIFVEVMEQAEDAALYQQIPFYKALRKVVFENEK